MKYKNVCITMSLGALLSAPMWATAQTVTSFTVVNADTGQDIETFTSPTGAISLQRNLRINVRANTQGDVGSVVFAFKGGGGRTENALPYALMGDNSGNYSKWSPALGTYEISATPFTLQDGQGRAGQSAMFKLTVAPAQGVTSFTVIDADTGRELATFAQHGVFRRPAGKNIALRANTSDGVGSVIFYDAQGRAVRTENTAPFSLMGNSRPGKFDEWTPNKGLQVISAKAFAKDNGRGQESPMATLSLMIEDEPVAGGLTDAAKAAAEKAAAEKAAAAKAAAEKAAAEKAAAEKAAAEKAAAEKAAAAKAAAEKAAAEKAAAEKAAAEKAAAEKAAAACKQAPTFFTSTVEPVLLSKNCIGCHSFLPTRLKFPSSVSSLENYKALKNFSEAQGAAYVLSKSINEIAHGGGNLLGSSSTADYQNLKKLLESCPATISPF